MKTKIIWLLPSAIIAALLPCQMFAVPTTYDYTGNPFATAPSPYTTSDFVTATVTLAGPLGANMPLTTVSPTAFSLSDGVQTFTNLTCSQCLVQFATDSTGAIIGWDLVAGDTNGLILTQTDRQGGPSDVGSFGTVEAFIRSSPGTWMIEGAVPDTGSTLLLMTLTLMAFGLVAWRFQRAAA